MKAERKLAKSEGVSKVRTSSTAMKNNLSLESGQAVSRTAASGHGNASFYVSPKPSILPHTFSWKNNDSTAGKVCFTTLDQADPLMQFCLACTFLNDIAVAQRLLPDVLLSLPSHVSIGDLRVPGPDFRILDLACRFGNTEIVSWLCGDERTRCMVTAGTAVAWAVYTGQVEIAKLVVQHGADPTTTDSVCFGSKPPLFMAAENGQLLAMKWLVEEVGQDLNMRCPEHGSVLDACKAKGFGKSNMTPSHRACADWVHSKR